MLLVQLCMKAAEMLKVEGSCSDANRRSIMELCSVHMHREAMCSYFAICVQILNEICLNPLVFR